MRISVDVGYNSTKHLGAKGVDQFLSTVKERKSELENGIIVEYEGKEYIIGDINGYPSSDANKINDSTFRLCLFTAIALNMTTATDTDVRVITGLPMQYFKHQKEDLVKSLEGLNVNLKLNGKNKTFTITKVLVFPQSAGMFLTHKELLKDEALVIDIGGGTVDVSYFDNGEWKKGATYALGVNTLYDNILQSISKHGVSYNNRMKAIDIIKNGYIHTDAGQVNVSQEIIEEFKERVKEIIETVKGGFTEFPRSKKVFIGGGSLLLQDYIPFDVIDQAEYVNVKIFDRVGDAKNV